SRRGAPRGRAAGRRPARASPRDELEPGGHVANLPPERRDLVAQPVGLAEVPFRARALTRLGQPDDFRRRVLALAERGEAEDRQALAQVGGESAAAPVVEERERLGRVEVVVEDGCEAFLLDRRGSVRRPEELAERVDLRLRLRQRVVVEVDRIPPVRRQEEEEHDLASPCVEHVAKRAVVAERLRHLLAAEREHPVVHPDLRELVAARVRLRDLVLVMREDEVEPAAVDLEGRPERSAGHRRALDVPARPPRPPRRRPRGVLAGLRRLPQREVLRRLLARVPLLLLHLVHALPREPAVLRVAPDAEVDVALDRVRVAALHELLDERHDRRHVLRRLRHQVGEPEAEVADVLDVPARRPLGELGARTRGGVVDLVVDVGDVVHERGLVAAPSQPAPQPHPDHERPRVADVRALVDGRPAEVHPDRSGARRQLLELPRQRAVQPHAPTLRRSSSRGRAAITAASSGPRSRPVRASRTAFRSPPTAFSSRTMARASSPPSTSSRNRASVSGESASTTTGSSTCRAYSRASFRSRAPRRTGATETGTPTRAASSSSASEPRASVESRRRRARSRWTSCRGSPSSSRYARTASAGIPPARRSAIEVAPWRFDSLCPSSPRS